MNKLSIVAIAGACISSASAQVVYSHFGLNQTLSTAFVAPNWEVGERVTLAGGAQSLGLAECKFGASASNPNGEGTLNLTFYNNDAGTAPGSQIATFAAPVSLVGTGPIIVSFNLGSLAVPSPVWVSCRFERTSGGNTGVIVNTLATTVGSVSNIRAFRQFGTGAWGTDLVNDWMVFQLTAAAAAGCYPNCDSSTTPPILNVQDFSCFLNAFAAGDSYANCDSSTTAPVLNVQDFSCFLNAFAAGCS